jgi:LuxR family transcriptional regulator, maltose regulon positive regulatory protein
VLASDFRQLSSSTARLFEAEYSGSEQSEIMTPEQQHGFADTPELLRTKLLPPRLRAPLVLRESLLARLDAALSCKLTLCTAPAGFGKTTLISQWLYTRRLEAEGVELREPNAWPASTLNARAAKLAWVSLDAEDNSAAQFWRYLIGACQPLRLDFGQDAMARLQLARPRGFAPPDMEPALSAFLNDAATLTQPAVIVLEDYHVITASRVHETLAFVIERLPPMLHLLVISRGDPPLPLARLRAAGELCELYIEDLRFSPTETSTFVGQALPQALSPQIIRRLDERCEGWAAGLRLATLALRGRTPAAIERLLDTFNGTQPPVVDYLVAEVLQAQPEAIQLFLLQTSMLGRLTASLCDAVTGRDDGAELLRTIEQSNLFLLPLDETPSWYRYHSLFAEAMRHEAYRRLGHDALRAYAARASAWYEQHGMLTNAIDLALTAQEWARAIALMEPIVEALHIAQPYEPRMVRRWLEQLPKSILHQQPALCFGYGFALLHTSGQPPAAIAGQLEELGQLAEQGWRRNGQLYRLGPLYAARALFALWAGQMERAISWAREALAWLPADDVTWRGVCLGFVGKAELDDGAIDAARQTLLEARALSQATGSGHATRAHTIALGHVCVEQSELHQASALYHDALTEALDSADLSDQGRARRGLARLAYEWNDLDQAERQGRSADAIGKQIADLPLQVQANLLLARIQQARNDVPQAQTILAALLAQVSPHRTPQLYREVLLNQARLQLAAGDLAAVQRWQTARTRYGTELAPALVEQEDVLVARLLIALGEQEAALRTLGQLHRDAGERGRLRSALEIQLLMALALAACNRAPAASDALREALAQAHTAGYCRLFLDGGPPLIALLRDLAPSLREPGLRQYAHHLLQMFMSEPDAPDPAALLSPQEQRVLRLLAGGRSNPEIAQELVVSVNTIKTQLKQIYRKLRVTSRQEACAMAEQLRLR